MQTIGKYVVIEGHDGTGKSTQVGLVRKNLLEQGIDSIEFHEPAGSLIADAIRTVIKNGKLPRDAVTNLLLFSAARHDIWFRQALPALAAGKWVIASRNYYSTLAYQGHGEGLDTEIVSAVTRVATDDQYLRPDIAIILDLDNETERQKRIAGRGSLSNPDTFEAKDDTFQSKVNKGYTAIASTHNNIPIVSAAQSVDQVQREIWDIIIREL